MSYEAEAALQLQKLMDRMRRIGRMEPVEGVSHREFFTLHVLRQLCQKTNGSVRMGELARALEMPMPSVSKVVQTLEERGFVERRTDPSDRRNTLASLTPKGEALEIEADRNADERAQALFSRFGENETSEFVRLLSRLVELAEQQAQQIGKERAKTHV